MNLGRKAKNHKNELHVNLRKVVQENGGEKREREREYKCSAENTAKEVIVKQP